MVTARLAPGRRLRFVPPPQRRTFRTLLDALLGQEAGPRVPVAETVDARLAAGAGDGYRHHELPGDAEAWLRSLEALDQRARTDHGCPFERLTSGQRRELLDKIRNGGGDLGAMPAARVFGLWMRYACDAFYAHPWAWNEIGFPGPAYPRGYSSLGPGRRESFEVEGRPAGDPVPWAERVAAARRRHAGEAEPPCGG